MTGLFIQEAGDGILEHEKELGGGVKGDDKGGIGWGKSSSEDGDDVRVGNHGGGNRVEIVSGAADISDPSRHGLVILLSCPHEVPVKSVPGGEAVGLVNGAQHLPSGIQIVFVSNMWVLTQLNMEQELGMRLLMLSLPRSDRLRIIRAVWPGLGLRVFHKLPEAVVNEGGAYANDPLPVVGVIELCDGQGGHCGGS